MLALLIMAGANVVGGGFMFRQARMRAEEERARAMQDELRAEMMKAEQERTQALEAMDEAEARLKTNPSPRA